MKRKLILIAAVALFAISQAKAETYIKLNAVYAALGIINPAIEVGVAKQFTVQVDVVASFWQEHIKGMPLIMGIGYAEGRWYPKGRFNGFFVGPSVGYGVYKLQRPDYWGTTRIQYGSSVFLGADLGYVWRVSNWSFELFLGYGWQYGIYEGYDTATHSRYDLGEYPGKYNISAEWMPFKFGLMVGYRF